MRASRGSAASGAFRREGGRHLSGRHPGAHGEVGDPVAVVGDPIYELMAGTAKFFRSHAGKSGTTVCATAFWPFPDRWRFRPSPLN